MEREFYPYLQIEFCRNPQKCGGVGIVLQTKDDNIKKNFTFKNDTDIENLRDLIWFHLKKEENIINSDDDIANSKDENMLWYNSSQKMRLVNPINEPEFVTSCPQISTNDNDKDIRNKLMHSSYKMQKFKPSTQTTEKTCINNRNRECDQKSPIGSEANSVCKSIGKALCVSLPKLNKEQTNPQNKYKTGRNFNPIGYLYPTNTNNIEHFEQSGKSNINIFYDWLNKNPLIVLIIILISISFIKQ